MIVETFNKVLYKDRDKQVNFLRGQWHIEEDVEFIRVGIN